MDNDYNIQKKLKNHLICNYNFRDNYYNNIYSLEYDIYNYQISHNHQEQIFKVSIIYSLLGQTFIQLNSFNS